MTVCLTSTAFTCVTRLMVGENRPGPYQQPARLSAHGCRNAVGMFYWIGRICALAAAQNFWYGTL
jgi:hypothetical protein